MSDQNVWTHVPDDSWDPARDSGPVGAEPPTVAGSGLGGGAVMGGRTDGGGLTRRMLVWTLAPLALITLVAMIALWPRDARDGGVVGDTGERAYGRVEQVVEEVCPPIETPAGPQFDPQATRCGTATVRITGGAGPGGTVTLELPNGPGTPEIHPGDDLVLLYLSEADAGTSQYTIIDHQRGRPMLWLVALTAAAIIALGRWRGLAALAGLAVSFAVLLAFVIPAILDGSAPLLVAVVGAAAIAIAVLYLTHGVNPHTSVAILGTLASLVLTGLLGAGFTLVTQLTGVASEETVNLSITQASVDMRGLLLAGIIIGSLGVLDDVTVTQAVAVEELARTARSRWELYRAAIRVGRAHVGAAVNTLVLAYAGASLPLLLLLAEARTDISDLLTGEFFAQEIVRSAVGTIGLVASVPITTALAVLVTRRPAGTEPPVVPAPIVAS